MYKSEQFGRIFWVDDDFNLQSCPLYENGTGDFDNADYVSDWDDFSEVNIPLLLDIYKTEIFNKTQYAGSLSLSDSYTREVI